MLHIVMPVGSLDAEWHIKEPFPIEYANIDMVQWIQADGHELETINRLCANLPRSPHSRVVRWFGDHAKFICSVLDSDCRVKGYREQSQA